MKKASKLPISTFELVWYALTGAVALWGLTYIILGMIGMYAPVAQADNKLAAASDELKKVFGLGFFGWGLIIFATGAVAATICLVICSKSADREQEKAARRAARVASVRNVTETVVDAETKPLETKAE